MRKSGMTEVLLHKMRLQAPEMITIPTGEETLGTSEDQLEYLKLKEGLTEEW